uniref:carboxylesterase n=1 Tax=Culicoides sonorensis TaxID=179676 RepID=A0A336LKN6_CULSO
MKFLCILLINLLVFIKSSSTVNVSMTFVVNESENRHEKLFVVLKEAIVLTKEGLLRGHYHEDKGYYAFLGVRYGQPPIGSKRFKRPVPERPWNGIRNALKPGDDCAQINPIIRAYHGSEDCLFLNVFTNVLPYDKHFVEPLPVMFYIHGGGFTYGSGNDILQDPQYLVEKNVIVVAINYRLGPLGFLCVGKSSRGNMGIHDQILALKWVHRNIAAFGGDPKQVTVFGFSAGAASVDILTLSSLAKNYFRGAIAQSGSMLNPWANILNPVAQGFRLGKFFGYQGTSTDELVKFLKLIPAKSLIETATRKLKSPHDERNVLGFNFVPCIEENEFGYEPDYEPVLKENPVDILKHGNYRKIPQIKGFTTNEGLFFIKNLLYPTPTPGLFNKSDLYYLPANLDTRYEHEFNIPYLVDKIKSVYTRLSPKSVTDALVTFGTDVFFVHAITQELRAHVRNGNKHVFAYRFDYDGYFNFAKRLSAPVGEPGIAHGDELGYIFGAVPIAYIGLNSENTRIERMIRENMVTMWTNFAKYGFIGIRYGEAPIGKRRFKEALPEKAWNGIRSAFQYGSVCSQVPPITGKYTGSEDCLFLNVYTKILPDQMEFKENQPVLVYFHGGAFYTGSGNDLISGPELLVSQDIIFVSINYRLGPLGFLCVGKESSGNMGLHDQILALKWIQRNIAAFGGDPSKVTLMGFSAGAVSIEILMLSRLAKGLFRSVITQSGSFLNPWAFAKDPKEQGFRLGKILGYHGESTSELVEFLQNVSAQDIVEAAMNDIELATYDRNPLEIIFTPCLHEKKYKKHNRILEHHPIKILKRGLYKKVPQIKGFNSNEATVIFYNTLYDTKAPTNFFKSESYFVPANLATDKLNYTDIQLLVNAIKTAYLSVNYPIFSGKNTTLLEALTKYGTDIFFIHGIWRSINEVVRSGNNNQVFVYRFAFEGNFNFPSRFSGAMGQSHGAGHGDELGYLFTAPLFAYLGTDTRDKHPTPPGIWDGNVIWEPIRSPKNFTYLNIKDTLQLRHKLPFAKRMAFWDYIYDHYGYKLS